MILMREEPEMLKPSRVEVHDGGWSFQILYIGILQQHSISVKKLVLCFVWSRGPYATMSLQGESIEYAHPVPDRK